MPRCLPLFLVVVSVILGLAAVQTTSPMNITAQLYKTHTSSKQALSPSHSMTEVTSTSGVGDVYFLSHGGPPSIEQTDSDAFKAWRRFGEIIRANRPKGIVVVSAHWENSRGLRSGVIVNNNPANPLIYDFYNFPKHFYQLKFASKGDPKLHNSILEALGKNNVGFSQEDRGLDHGVWIPFKAAFGEETDIPIVQVSLPGSADPQESVKLGKALSQLRDQGYAVIGTGQIVHNLRDLFSGSGLPYTSSFLETATKAAIASDPISATLSLTQHPLFRNAHPTDEHFYPLLVSTGASRPSDKAEVIYQGVIDTKGKTVKTDGLGWGMYRWTKAS